MLELINSNYTFLTKELADYYGIEGLPAMIFKNMC